MRTLRSRALLGLVLCVVSLLAMTTATTTNGQVTKIGQKTEGQPDLDDPLAIDEYNEDSPEHGIIDTSFFAKNLNSTNSSSFVLQNDNLTKYSTTSRLPGNLEEPKGSHDLDLDHEDNVWNVKVKIEQKPATVEHLNNKTLSSHNNKLSDWPPYPGFPTPPNVLAENWSSYYTVGGVVLFFIVLTISCCYRIMTGDTVRRRATVVASESGNGVVGIQSTRQSRRPRHYWGRRADSTQNLLPNEEGPAEDDPPPTFEDSVTAAIPPTGAAETVLATTQEGRVVRVMLW